MTRDVRAVFFDFGGTLFSYRALSRAAFAPFLAAAAERLGVEASSKEVAGAYGRASTESFRDFNPRAYYLHRDLFLDTYRRFAQALGKPAGEDFAEWMYEEQRVMFLEGCVLRPDCLETLRALREAGLHVAIVSNIDDDYLHPMIEKVGLHRVLDAWTSSQEAGSCKPDSAIFDCSLQKAGVSAGESFFVGDSPVHDIVGALRAGMRTALIREQGGPAPGTREGEGAEAHHTIEALAELVPIILAPRK